MSRRRTATVRPAFHLSMHEKILKDLYLIRHGQTDYNLSGRVQGSGIDAPLNETGRRQAEAFYQSYRHIPFDKIYISRLQRTMQTVEGFLQEGVPYQQMAELNEISWGSMEGTVLTEIGGNYYKNILQGWKSGQLHVPVGDGESPLEVAERQRPAIDLIMGRHDERRVLVCMHGRAMRIFLCQLLGKSLIQMDDFIHHNTGVYHLQFLECGNRRLIRTNCLRHLEEVA